MEAMLARQLGLEFGLLGFGRAISSNKEATTV
jgi:hypothetical protein